MMRAVTRSLTGHKSEVLCLDFSIYGLASGSMDTNIKVQLSVINSSLWHRRVQWGIPPSWLCAVVHLGT